MRARKADKISYAGIGCYLSIRSPVFGRDRSRSRCFPFLGFVIRAKFTLCSRPTGSSRIEHPVGKTCGLEVKGERRKGKLGSSITKENYCSICRSHFFTTNHPAAIYIQRLPLLIVSSERNITKMLLLKKYLISLPHAFFQYISRLVLGSGGTGDNLDQLAGNDGLASTVEENLELVDHVAGVLGGVVHGVTARGLLASVALGETPEERVGQSVLAEAGEDGVVNLEGGEVG